jgi:hypothetical protein
MDSNNQGTEKRTMDAQNLPYWVKTTLDFTTGHPQEYWDSWRNTVRTCQYAGDCCTCDTRTYAFTDGENDPRGILGSHAAYPLRLAENSPVDHKDSKVEVPQCFECGNSEPMYKAALQYARDLAKKER